ncbi:MAG: DUF5119 domain-containing protein [Bacteroidales bacterium]|nr:DUF5119 domain-containing protein [Bacteroidales bacterium]
MRFRIPLLLAAGILLLCCSKPLDVKQEGLSIVLDNDLSLPFRPEAAAPYHFGILLYDDVSGKFVYEDFCEADGGRIPGQEGQFTAVVYDLDNSAIRFDGKASLESFRVYSEEEVTAVKDGFFNCQQAFSAQASEDGVRIKSVKGNVGFEEGPVIQEPGELFAGVKPHISIPAFSQSREDFSFQVSTRFALQQGRIRLQGIKNTQYIHSVRVYLTNVARGRYVGTGLPEENPAILSFPLNSIGEDLIEGTFNYFGLLSDTELPNTAYIIITDLAGGMYLYVIDVSSSLREGADLPVQWDYELPSPETGSAGFSPVLNEWDAVWYDISIGVQ